MVRSKVRLGGSHSQGNRRHLNDFRGMLAHHVASHDPIRGLINDQFEKAAVTIGWQSPLHRTETGPVHRNPVASETFSRLLFRQTHRSKFRVAEHRLGDQIMIDLAGTVSINVSANTRPSSIATGVRLTRSVTSPTA